MTSSAGTTSHARQPSSSQMPAPLITPAWQMLAEQILHLAQFGSSVQVICAAARAGKTTFLQFLSGEAGEAEFHKFAVPKDIAPAALFRNILLQLGLRPSDEAKLGELIVALRSFAQSLAVAERRVIIALDDAQRLQPSELAALISVLQGSNGAGFGLHFLLVAEPGLAERIDELQLLDVAVHDVYLPAFSPGEIKALLERAAQASGESLQMNAAALQNLWAESEGLPGRALALMHEYVVESPLPAEVPAPRRVPGEPPRQWPYLHIAAVVLLCCVLIWAIVVRDDGVDEEAQTQNSPAETPLVVDGRLSLPVTVDAPQSPPPEAPPLPAGSTVTEPQAQQEEADRIQSPLSGQSGSEPPVPVQSAPAPAPVDQERSEAALPVKEPALTPAPAGQPATSGALSEGGHALLRDGEAKLLRYSPEAYVLQLMATGSLSTLTQFHAAQPNRSDLLIHRGKRDGKVLYFLVEGFYADADSAKAAVLNLPANQRTGGPWPKKMGQIQAEIRQVGDS